jgi:uncharacterized membrane protein
MSKSTVLPINLDKNERVISLLAGLVMIVYGLVRLPLTAVMALIGGSYFLYRAIKGHCYIYAQLGLDKIKESPTPYLTRTAERQHVNAVDATLNQTFPTSDPPAWMMGRDQ